MKVEEQPKIGIAVIVEVINKTGSLESAALKEEAEIAISKLDLSELVRIAVITEMERIRKEDHN